MGAMWEDMPDPREGDEAAWEDVYLGREPVDYAELERELRTLKDAYAKYYGSNPPVSVEEREEAAEMQERIAEIVAVLDAAEVPS